MQPIRGAEPRAIWLSLSASPGSIAPLLIELLATSLPDPLLRRALLEEFTAPVKDAAIVLAYLGLREFGLDAHGEVPLLLVAPRADRDPWRDALLAPGAGCPIGVLVTTRDRGPIALVHEGYASFDAAAKALVRRYGALAVRGVSHAQILEQLSEGDEPSSRTAQTVIAARRRIQGVVDASALPSPDGSIRVQLGSLSETTTNLLREGLHGEYVFILPSIMFEERTNYADIEFVVYLNFFMQRGRRTRIVGTVRQRELLARLLKLVTIGLFDLGQPAGPAFEAAAAYGVPDRATYDFLRCASELYAPRVGGERSAPVLGFEAYVDFSELEAGRVTVPIHESEAGGRPRHVGTVDIAAGDGGTFDVRITQADGRSASKKMNVVRRRRSIGVVPEGLAAQIRFGTDRPRFGVTPLGTSHGFDPTDDVTSFVIWINGRGLLVDPSPQALLYLEQIGVAPGDVPYVFLTHIHADHDGGLIEKLLAAQRTTVIASDVVFRGFVDKVELVTGHHIVREDLALHVPANPGVPVTLEIGGETAALETRWNLHPIPTNGFKITVGGQTFGYSGDTQYDPAALGELHARGRLPTRHFDDLMHFFWTEDGLPLVHLLYHEAGSPPIHTDKAALAALPTRVQERTALVHIADRDVPAGFVPAKPRLFATHTLLPKTEVSRQRILLDSLRLVSYLYDVPAATLAELLRGVAIREYAREEFIVRQGPLPRGEPLNFYAVVDGAAEVRDGRRVLATLAKGDSFGEWGISHQRGFRVANVVAARPCQCLEFTEAQYRWLVGCHPIIQERIGKIRMLLPRLQVAQGRARARREADPLVRPSVISNMTAGQLSSFALFSAVGAYKEGQSIILEGTEADAFYILLSGHVAVRAGGRLMGEMGEGDIFGEIGLLEGGPRGATVSVVSADAEVLFMSAPNFRTLLSSVPAFSLEVRETAARRISPG